MRIYVQKVNKILYFLCAGSGRKLKTYTDTQGNPVPFKWTPGYVSATLAEAWADVLRTKAQAKYNKTENPNILPQPTPVPSKSKNFAYTSIRLTSDFTGAIPEIPTAGTLLQSVQANAVPVPAVQPQQQVTNPFVTTTSVPVSGAREQQAPPTTNPFVTTQVPVSGARAAEVPPAAVATTAPVSGARTGGAVAASAGVPPGPQQADELQAKLQQLQKQLTDLEALKAQLDAQSKSGAAAGSRRKMLDSGLPGWDPGMLLEKVQLDSIEGIT